ncbi:MAG: type II secretion system F family protein [Planctomycetota bacterium]
MAKKLQRNPSARPSAARSSGDGARAERKGSKKAGGRRIAKDLVTDFTHQLATLTEAGIPVVRSLQILEGQAKAGPFRAMLGELVEDVSSGTPLSDAMAKHERTFDRLFSAMVRAGETGGVLDTVLLRIADYRERAAEIRSKILSAMVYPVVVIFFALCVIAAAMTWVIPKFREVLTSLGTELPAPTQVLLAASDFTVEYWYVVIGVPVALVVLHFVMLRASVGYRYFVHRSMMRIPYLGSVLALGQVAGFSRTFGTLVQAGVPHLDALAIARDTTDNEVFYTAIDDVRTTVREGETIARPMNDSGVFDPLVCNMVEVGEQTGELDGMLLKVAAAYEVQVKRKIDLFFRILEPILLILIAGMVGFLVVSMFLPLLRITASFASG